MTEILTDKLNKCECCPRKCGINRFEKPLGFCRTGAVAQVSHTGLHFGEEPPISGINGSGTIFFTGCNLRCVFCQNYQISQEFSKGSTCFLSIEDLSIAMTRLQNQGAHNINLVSPSHMIFQIAEAIKLARKNGLVVPVVYNSNGYDSVEALRQICGLVDIYLPDIKYQDDDLAMRFSSADNYSHIVRDVIREMLTHVGHLDIGDDGIARQGVLVRHLVLPNYLENSRKCLRFLTDLAPEISVSIMSQYSPQYHACHFSEINRPLSNNEYRSIIDYAFQIGLENVYVQEMDSQEHYLPDFNRDNPFGDIV